MGKMNGKDRIISAINKERMDRVPIGPPDPLPNVEVWRTFQD